jgi:DNA polymerase III delta prime subunit
VLAALRGENFLLIGPPGCGKTQTSAAIIANLCAQFPAIKIAFASPVAAAIDALRRLTHGLKADYAEILIGKDHPTDTMDLLIVDESSRTTTAEIFPYAAKAAQIILIGDPKQTPPSPAAPRLDAADTSLIDRALKNTNFGQYELRNHYRSQHPDLLSFPNGFIYDGRLRVVPALRREITDGLCIKYVPQATAVPQRHSTKNVIEAKVLAHQIVNAAIDAQSRGVMRSRMAVGWTYHHARLIESSIKARLKKLKLSEDILSPVPNEPFVVYTASEVQGQERDETWIGLGFGLEPKKPPKLAVAYQSNVDMSPGVLQTMNVLTTRSRIATHIYHSIAPKDLLAAKPTPELLALLALITSEMLTAHARFQLHPSHEANSVARRKSGDYPSITKPEAVDLGCVFGVRNEGDPPDCWTYGLFKFHKYWTTENAQIARAMLQAKGWDLITM